MLTAGGADSRPQHPRPVGHGDADRAVDGVGEAAVRVDLDRRRRRIGQRHHGEQMSTDPVDAVDPRRAPWAARSSVIGRASSCGGAAAVMSPVRISTRRFCARPSGLSLPSGLVFGATGRDSPNPTAFKSIRFPASPAVPPYRRGSRLGQQLIGRVVANGVGMPLDRDHAFADPIWSSTPSSAACAAGVRSDLPNSNSTSLGSLISMGASSPRLRRLCSCTSACRHKARHREGW